MNKLKSIFLPIGKIHSNYKQYTKWSFLSNVVVSVQTAITTHNMLSSLTTTPAEYYKTVNYIGKDILGQMGGLIYISKMSVRADTNPKSFLIYSNILQQSSFVLMSLTPFIDYSYFIFLAGMSNILVNISFTGFGAINAKCVQKLSIDNNICEIYSKITVVNTIASSIGLGVGLGLIYLIPNSIHRICLLPILGICRVYTYNKAITELID